MRAETSPNSIVRSQRTDIQALRGLAIILVLLHHARIAVVPGGFLGVDIFFVISGFLMAGLIDEALDNGTFSFASFYARRARRLLPAAYATLLVTAAVAPFLLDATEYRYFLSQLAGSFGFVVNFVLWQQTDYFGSGAELKPLLHMWSLSVEEQFYIFLPMGMLLATKRFRFAAIVALVMVSGALCIYVMRISPSATFYMLPTRAWELGLGSMTALLVRGGTVLPRPMPMVRIACAAVLIAVPLVADAGGHPGLPAAICCVATAILLVPGAMLGSGKVLAPMTWSGDRSYSLYLVHWPIFSLVNNIYIEPVPQYLNVALLLACLAWTEVQYRFVEQPYRRLVMTPKVLAVLFTVPLLCVGVSAVVGSQLSGGQRFTARTPNHGLSDQCTFKKTYDRRAACQSGPHPQILVWGDSFAMHVVPGMLASAPNGVAQATRFVCGPFVGIAPMDRYNYPLHWAKSCIAFNDSVIAALANWPDIHYVVLATSMLQYMPNGEDHDWHTLVRNGGAYQTRPREISSLSESLQLTVDKLHAMGKKVILFTPPPSTGIDTSRCIERRLESLPTVSENDQCTFSRSEYQDQRRDMLSFLGAVQQQGIVPTMSLDQRLCNSGTCLNRIDNVTIYQDRAHLSIEGSRYLGQQMDWAAIIANRAM